MSARTAVEVADRRRDLAQHDIRAADALGRAAAYALAAQQAPALVLGWSWVVSLVRDGVRPAHVREALADALTADGVPFPPGPRLPRREPAAEPCRWDGVHDVTKHWDAYGGDVLARSCTCGERWTSDQDECPEANYDQPLEDR